MEHKYTEDESILGVPPLGSHYLPKLSLIPDTALLRWLKIARTLMGPFAGGEDPYPSGSFP